MRILVAASCLLMSACAGDDSGEQLVASSLTASYDGAAFTPTFGFAAPYMSGNVLALGDGAIRCGTQNAPEPPPGRTAVFSLASLDAGTYGSVFVQMFTNVGEFEGVGANRGNVTITTSTDATIAGMVSFDYTDDEQRVFTIAGTFEAVRCP